MNITSIRFSTIACLAAAIMICITGCATMSGVEKPSVNLAGLWMAEVKSFETIFQIELRVFNPGTTPLNIQGIDCDLVFNDRHLAKGVVNPQKEIPAYGSDIVSVKVYASMFGLFGAAYRLIRDAQSETPDEQWTYAVKGHLDMGGGMWPGKIPFDAEGEINVKELMVTKP